MTATYQLLMRLSVDLAAELFVGRRSEVHKTDIRVSYGEVRIAPTVSGAGAYRLTQHAEP